LLAVGRKAEGGTTGPRGAAPAVDEGIEHDAEELIGELKRRLLAAGRSLAREERQRVGEVAAGEPEDADEAGRQRATVVEEIIERVRDVLLIDAEAGPAEPGGEIQDYVGRGVAE